MTNADKLAQVCLDGFAHMDALDARFYRLGYVTRRNTRGKIKSAPGGALGDTKGKGPSPLPVNSPNDGPKPKGPGEALHIETKQY